ncbi:MAG: TonB-dependent receptor [Chitinophagaceae bacterium]
MRKSTTKLRKVLSVTFALMLFSTIAWSQTVVTGKVTDSKDGAPVSGVTVNVKGTKVSAQTATDGTYKLTAPAGATTLVFTSVGFAPQQVPVGASVDISFVQTSTQLNDVVVIGYGSARKKDLTGSVTSISAKDFQKGNIQTPDQLIAGKVAGVSITSNGGAPGAGSTIRIRGGASLNASNDPLIVIDGVPVDNNGISGAANPLSLINPNDIESFNILKDASATAIYGSRASNGVIIITTKKGRKGKAVFNFNTNLSMGVISKKADILSPQEFRDFVNANGNPSQKALLGTANTDWQDEIYQQAIGSDNNLSATGSVGAMPYRVSLGYLNQNGILRTGNLQRLSTSINLSPKFLDDHLAVNVNLKATNTQTKFADEGAIGAAVNFDPTKEVMSASKRYGSYWEWLDPSSVSGLKSLAPRNPLGLLNQREDNSNVNRTVGNVQLDYKFHFLPALRLNVNLGFDLSRGKGTVVLPDSAAAVYMRFKDASNKFHGGVNNQYLQRKQNLLSEIYLNYVKDFKQINSRLDAMAGYSYQDFQSIYYNGTRPDATGKWTPYSDYTSDGTLVSTPTFWHDVPENRLLSYYSRVNFSVKSRYLFTATIRRDGSSRFAKDNRWGWFPSAAFAWKMKEEDFLKDSKVVTDLKLRLGYGVTGQQDGIGNYSYLANYSLGSPTSQYQFGSSYYQPFAPAGYNPNLKWEQTATTNIGFDFGFINNRIIGSVDYYFKKTKDLLNVISQPAGSNFSNEIIANVGNMENRGVEFTLNTVPVKNKNITWDLGFNMTYNKNEITNLTAVTDPNYPGNQFGGISGGTGNRILINSVGYNRGAFYVFQQAYNSNTGKPVDDAYVDLNGDGTINDKDLYRFKSVDPTMYFGASSNVSYKNWNAGFVMRASVGNYLYNNRFSSTGTVRNILNPLGYLANGSHNVIESGLSGNGQNYYMSDYYVENASFLRMDNINVGYNFGKIINNKAGLRVSANVQNVFVVTKYKGLDPEQNGGIDNNFYPRPRTFSLSANLDF